MRVVNHHARRHAPHVSGQDQVRSSRLGFTFSALLLVSVTAWSFWPARIGLFDAWRANDDYSAGQLVPLVAIFFIWRDWNALGKLPLVPCWLGGIALLLLPAAVRTYGFLCMVQPSIERYSLVLMVAGLVLMVAGWQVFRRVFWIFLFLFLMFPLPGVLHNLIAGPLRGLATTGSVVLLEAVGASVRQQGNVVMLGENTPMAVAEACSGLRMLTAFIIVAAFIAYMVKRPRWQKAILLASSIPVAVVCNIVRIFATGLLMLHVSSEVGEKFFHDFAGLVMMPAAVLLLFGELWLLDKLVVLEPSAAGPPSSVVRRARSDKRTVLHAQRKARDVRLPDT